MYWTPPFSAPVTNLYVPIREVHNITNLHVSTRDIHNLTIGTPTINNTKDVARKVQIPYQSLRDLDNYVCVQFAVIQIITIALIIRHPTMEAARVSRIEGRKKVLENSILAGRRKI